MLSHPERCGAGARGPASQSQSCVVPRPQKRECHGVGLATFAAGAISILRLGRGAICIFGLTIFEVNLRIEAGWGGWRRPPQRQTERIPAAPFAANAGGPSGGDWLAAAAGAAASSSH